MIHAVVACLHCVFETDVVLNGILSCPEHKMGKQAQNDTFFVYIQTWWRRNEMKKMMGRVLSHKSTCSKHPFDHYSV